MVFLLCVGIMEIPYNGGGGQKRGTMEMDKKILQEYIDACELVRETENDIRQLNKKKKTIVQTTVKGSSRCFPYTEQRFKIRGSTFDMEDDSSLRREELLLQRRKAEAEEIKIQVEEWLLTIPQRMQRIVKYKFLEGLPWEAVAAKMGRKATADSVRKEFERFFAKK